MKKLKDILLGVSIVDVDGNTNVNVSKLTLDSRAVEKNTVFVAIEGTQVDGHLYINKAIENGASVIVYDKLIEKFAEGVTYVKVKNSSEALGVISSNFYDNPSSKMQLVAITGTNGKTSVATLLYQLFTKMGYACGLLSTVENKIIDKVVKATHTTPNAVAINALLAEMVAAGCSYCFMEASSHAIHQNRMFGLQLAGAVFTNLTHDHLDYHKTFKEYLLAKKALFDNLPKTAFALANADDKNGKIMLQNTVATKKYYAIKGKADFSARVLESDFSGTMLNINGNELHVKLIGDFNAYNLLAVYGVAKLLNQETTDVLVAMSTLSGAEGRFEYSISKQNNVVGIVDYAHTPDALKKVLETINMLNSKRNNIITVVGCGGDRDKTKRPLMAAISAKLSNKVILTSDNPRTEQASEILADMMKGIGVLEKKKTLVIENRKEAIRTAVMLANEEDIILVAGKGHENYQEINGIRHHFDDKEELLEAFELMCE
ncbi:MAG: UDP-N-acetylmuramoyl-L-alanyl-D-glutamate--2,6-diaminopimelate ligase [Chitinophagales bacterium]